MKMNLRLPQRKDLSDSQTNITASQHTLQLPVNRKHTSFKMMPFKGPARLQSSTSYIKPFLVQNNLNMTQAFQFRAFRGGKGLIDAQKQMQINDSVKTSDPNVSSRVSPFDQPFTPKQTPYSQFQKMKKQNPVTSKYSLDRGSQQQFFGQGTRPNEAQGQMMFGSEIDKQSHSDYSVSREGSNNRLIDSMQITIQSLEAGGNILKNIPNNRLDSGKSLFFQQHAKMANHNQPMGSITSNPFPFTLTRQIINPQNSSGGINSDTPTGANIRAISNLTAGPRMIENRVGKRHEAYKTQQMLAKNNSKPLNNSNSQLYSGCATLETYRKKIKKLEKQLTNTKIFLNMVIHDMRNPTNSIEYALKEVIKVINLASQDQVNKPLPPQSPNFLSLQRSIQPIDNIYMASLRNSQSLNSQDAGNQRQQQQQPKLPLPLESPKNITASLNFTTPSFQLKTQQPLIPPRQPPQSLISQNLIKNGHHLEQVSEEDIFQESRDEDKLDDDFLINSVHSSLQDINEESMIPAAATPSQNIMIESKQLPDKNRLKRSYTKLNRQQLNRSGQNQSSQQEEVIKISIVKDEMISVVDSFEEEFPIERFENTERDHRVHTLENKPSVTHMTQTRIVLQRRVFIEDLQQEMLYETNNLQESQQQDNGLHEQKMNFESIDNIQAANMALGAHEQLNQLDVVAVQQQSKFRNPTLKSNQTEVVQTPANQGQSQADSFGRVNNFQSSLIGLGGGRVVSAVNIQNLEDHRKNILQNHLSHKHLSLGDHKMGHKLSSTKHAPVQILSKLHIEEEKKEALSSSKQDTERNEVVKRASSSQRRDLSHHLSSNENDSQNKVVNHGLIGTQKMLHSLLQSEEQLQGQNQHQMLTFFSPSGQNLLPPRSPGFPSHHLSTYQFNPFNQKGLILSIEDKKQCESLLKNSLFSSTMLLNLINDLLDLAKIENQAFNLNTTEFNLHEVIQKALDTLEFSAQQKTIDMRYVYDEQHVGYFMSIAGDDNRYLQILLNFLSNALKFTPTHGTINVEVRLVDTQEKSSKGGGKAEEPAGDIRKMKLQRQKTFLQKENGESKVKRSRSNEQIEKKEFVRKNTAIASRASFVPGKDQSQIDPRVIGEELKRDIESVLKKSNQPIEKYIKFEIRIQDSGYGISPENISKLFMNFSRLEDHAGENKRGTGLGLSICKSLIELMGGSVSVESELQKGTCFIMQLQTNCKYPNSQDIKSWLDKFKGIEARQSLSQNKNSHQGNNIGGIQINVEELKSNQGSSSNNSNGQNNHQRSPLFKYSCDIQFPAFKSPLQAVPSQQQSEKFLQIPLSRNKSKQNKNIQNQQQRIIPTIKIEKESSDQLLNFQDLQNNQNYQQRKDSRHNMIFQPAHQFPQMMNSEQQVQMYFSGNMLGEEEYQQIYGDTPQDFFYQDPTTMQNFLNFQQIMMSETKQPKQFRALIANDDSFQLQIICILMKKCGFIVDEAENGLVALQKHQMAKIPYDVILLDLDMPIMNGYDACQRIRKSNMRESLRQLIGFGVTKNTGGFIDMLNKEDESVQRDRLFIIALSGLITDSVIERGYRLGFDGFIEAPLTEVKIKETILTRLENIDLFLPQEISDEEEQFVEESENMSRHTMSRGAVGIPKRLSSRAVVLRRGTVLQNQAFSAVDEEQSNFPENEDTFSIQNQSVGHAHQDKTLVSNQILSGKIEENVQGLRASKK